MSVEERIEQVSNKEIAEALLLAAENGELKNSIDAGVVIVKAYGLDWTETGSKQDCKVIKDFFGRFAYVTAMYGLAEIAEMQQREKVEKMQLVLGIACDIAILFTSLGETTEIPSERLISFAEKIVERVQNA